MEKSDGNINSLDIIESLAIRIIKPISITIQPFSYTMLDGIVNNKGLSYKS